ncbi:MAG: C10 family peptidase [Prolixibacteraceae bacterium]|nr:C10 family peptidase [Prolixibacteraceae bacterium]
MKNLRQQPDNKKMPTSSILQIILLTLFVFYTTAICANESSVEKAKLIAEQFFMKQRVLKSGSVENSEIGLQKVYQSPDSITNKLYCFQKTHTGFIIVSENGGNFLIVGYSPIGSFNPVDVPEGLSSLLKSYENAIQLVPNTPNSEMSSVAVVEPLLDKKGINLNQFYHENVGNCPSGCVATALAQIMCYYKYPNTGKGSNCYSHSTYGQLCVDFGKTTYNWTNMTNEDYKLLSYHLGVGMNMNYCADVNGSTPSVSNYTSVLQKNFKYNIHSGTSESFYLRNELDNNRPIYCELPGYPSHSVVVDGYDANGYFHLNFGWGGVSNGYFLLNSNSTMNVGYTFGTNISSSLFISPQPFQINPQDSLALVSFHSSMNGKTGWDITKPVVNWPGVIVMNGRVISLKLTATLEGTISPEIGNLSALQNFSIRGNISGSFPSFITNLINLKELSINYYSNSSKVSLPSEIGKLINLESLSIKADGNIPKAIGNLTKLRTLDLSGGSLTGAIPDEIYSLTNLEELVLNNNQLSGSISSKIGQLTKLKRVSLWKNQLSGQLPVQIGNLVNLTDFYIAENQFSGLIPESIGNWTKLVNLSLNNNSFEGILPSAIGQFSQFSALIINNNKFSGLPESIGNLSELQQIVANNNLIESIPSSISKLSKLYRLDLTNNKLTTVPDLGTMPALWDLNLSNNQITVLPESFGRLQKITELYLDNNKLTELPSSFQNLSTLTTISANSNRLNSVPFGLTLLGNLKHLYLNNNQISGALPPLNHLGLLDLWLKSNNLIFSDIAASRMPDDSIYTDDYTFLYYDQAKVPVSDSVFIFSSGDPVSIDIRTISRLSHPANVYQWYKDNQPIQAGPVLKFTGFTGNMNGSYFCRVTNKKYKRNQTELETYPISITTSEDLLYAKSFQTTSRSNIKHEFTDHQVILEAPAEVRGDCQWQASADGVAWYNVSESMNQTEIKQNIVSAKPDRILVEPKTSTLFRYIVKEENCDPIISDAIKINPYGKLLIDTLITLKDKELRVKTDSIEIIFPYNFTEKKFRLTIQKLANPPESPDTVKLSSVYDVNLSCGSTFEVPLLMKFKNINKKAFSRMDIDKYKAVYFDDKNQKWVKYQNALVSLKDSSLIFETNHLTKLSWWFDSDTDWGYTDIFTKGRVNVVYKSGSGKSEEISYTDYESNLKKYPSQPWHDTNSDPSKGGNPYLIQDVAAYMNQIMDKFEALGLATPWFKIIVYVSQSIDAAGATPTLFQNLGNYYFNINPSFAPNPPTLMATLAHEYMHLVQDYYMLVNTNNYFWTEATAPLADRMVWDDTQQPLAEPEVILSEVLYPGKDSKSIFEILAQTWYDDNNIPVFSKAFTNSLNPNIAGTFLHYMRSYRTGDKLKPEVLLKETTWFETWLSYLDNYIQKNLKSKIGDEYDAFVRYIVEGSNPKFSLLNRKQGEDPLKYFDSASDFITNKVFKFNNEKLLKDSVKLDMPSLSAKMTRIYNLNANQKIIVKYKRKSEKKDNLKVYLCRYNSGKQIMNFEEISEKDSSSFVIEKPGINNSTERNNIAFLLFINKDKSESMKVNYELKAYNIPDFKMFDNLNFTVGYSSSNQKIHTISNGTKEELDEIYIMPSVFRVYQYQYYGPMRYNSSTTDSTIVVSATSDWIEQTTTYNYLTGEMTIYDKEDWGAKTPNGTKDVREMTMVLSNVWLTPLPSNSYGISYIFKTNSSVETQNAIKSLSYTRKYTTWNESLIPPAYNPTITYTYVRTNYPAGNSPFNDVKLQLQFY